MAYNNWILTTDRGRQTWKYTGSYGDAAMAEISRSFTYDKKKNSNSGDKVYREQKASRLTPVTEIPYSEKLRDDFAKKAFEAAYRGVNYYQSLQADEGHWPGDYGGPLFLLPGMIIASYVTETPFPAPHHEMMKRYMLNQQNADGGWGLHIEGASTMFGTVLQYVSLRILGMNENEPEITVARKWILENGDATGIPPWGKFYLSLLGVYEWKGCDTLFPEFWLFPKSLPFHPSNYWCHCRMVYLPMAYCYGYKVTGKKTPLVEQLRKEIYAQPYAAINWSAARTKCAKPDRYFPVSPVLRILNAALNIYEKIHLKGVRKKALDFCLSYINAEDDHTNYIDIGPVNQVINSVAVWHAYGKDSEQFKKHVDRWGDYLWVAEDGMKMSGYNGSQLWDTAFATEAMVEGGFEKYFPETIKKAYNYIVLSRVKEEVRDHKKFFRHDSVGGWPFSTADHGWPITDCTSEGLKATLQVHHSALTDYEQQIPDSGLKQTADLLLSFQNKDGGWASYELMRAPAWIELFNPSEIFGNIMVDYSYTECSSACIQGLINFKKYFPEYREKAIMNSISRGIDFILSQQRADGSWYGSWAVCFTYGMWFAMEALAKAEGIVNNAAIKPAIEKGCAFLISKQNADGGWGENFESCVQKKYIAHEGSQIVNTAWAALSLMAVNYPDKEPVEKAIRLLINRQQATGDWEQEGISGVFNHNCMITYTSYRNVFPIWALGRWVNKYGLIN